MVASTKRGEMFGDEERQQSPETGDPDASETVDAAREGGEGTNPSQAAQPMEGGDQQRDETQTPAPEGDVGVPDELEDRTE
jgi:hypothetical protein